MVHPLVAASASVVCGHDEGGLVTVERVVLCLFPQTADEIVIVVGGHEIMVIASVVAKLVGLVESHIEHFGLQCAHGLGSIVIGDEVECGIAPHVYHVGFHPVEEGFPF